MHRRQGGASRRWTAIALSGAAAGMLGLTFASVPLYRLYCQATGYAGTPRTVNVAAPARLDERHVAVLFDSNVNSQLPWEFAPMQRRIEVRAGEETLVHYRAANRAATPVTGTATFNVTPDKAAKYFNKLECFCFSEQTLGPGEDVVMPVVFYVDPALLDDPETADVKTITLSYTFFRVNDETPRSNPDKVASGRSPDVKG